MATFLAQGAAPLTWWESEKARRQSRRAAVVWLLLLGALTFILVKR